MRDPIVKVLVVSSLKIYVLPGDKVFQFGSHEPSMSLPNNGDCRSQGIVMVKKGLSRSKRQP